MNESTIKLPKISIVTTNLNQADYLENTILSVVNQNYPNLEYIVIDGESSDSSIEIIKKYANSLYYWCSEKDDGLYYAINKGFDKSTGEILMWLNSDDMLHQGALFNVAEIFSTFPEVNWITGINISFDELGRVIGADRAKGFTKYDFYTYDYQWLQQESTAWRRTLWEQAGGKLSTNYKYASDFELWIRFFRFTDLFACDILIGGFRMRSGNQISLDMFEKYENEVRQIIRAENIILHNSVIKNINILKLIKKLRILLKYSILFDLKILARLLDKIERNIHKKPTKRIHINRLTCKFETI